MTKAARVGMGSQAETTAWGKAQRTGTHRDIFERPEDEGLRASGGY